ncbi:class I SAM-dependent methyltransferase [Kiloniella antarctica]|uniref:Class I SAM-dependent methyltransferase n=1 Tax=Kiloniella antarctica TaxID=1550907 RepID=A0ABW5BL30_9PROT
MSNKKLPTNISSKYFDILSAKNKYAEGHNVSELLRAQKNIDFNTAEIIEITYDLQAGTYVEIAEKNIESVSLYTGELANIITNYIKSSDTLLDIGTGEITTLSLLVRDLVIKPNHIFAFDVSWSRLYKGMQFACKNMGKCFDRFSPFVADINEIPFLDKSINITTSSHALEPNGAKLPELMAELFRVTKDKVILFEPCYEINTEEGKKRMDQLGYIKGIDTIVQNLGGNVIEKIKIKNISNPLNPTVCFVIDPPQLDSSLKLNNCLIKTFTVPGSNHPLQRVDDFYFSEVTGLCFPILKTIPILRSGAAILASALQIN